MKEMFIKLLCARLTWIIVFVYIFWLLAAKIVNVPENTGSQLFIGAFLAVGAIYFSFFPARYISDYFKKRFSS